MTYLHPTTGGPQQAGRSEFPSQPEDAAPATPREKSYLNELWCPSADVCAICGDVYCDGISCIKDYDPDAPEDQPHIEQIQTWVRLGRLQEQTNAFLAYLENRA